jgi:hypothetical protein
MSLSLSLCLSGCVGQVVKDGGLIAISQTTLGINITATSSTSASPSVQLGLIKTVIIGEPVSTNQLHSADFSYSELLSQAANPLLFNGDTSVSSGHDKVNNNTNAVIVPYLPGYTNSVP